MTVSRLVKSVLLSVLALVAASVQAGVFVTADVYSTPGLDGYTTYDLSLSTSGGAFLSFVFDPAVGSGISGPLYQSPGFMGTASAVLDGGLDAGNRADSRFLLSPNAKTLNFNNSESDSHLATVFGTFAPDLDYSITTTPFARLVTNTPDLVHVLGSVGISPSQGADAQLFGVDFRLSDLAEWSSPMPSDIAEARAIAAAKALQAEIEEAERILAERSKPEPVASVPAIDRSPIPSLSLEELTIGLALVGSIPISVDPTTDPDGLVGIHPEQGVLTLQLPTDRPWGLSQPMLYVAGRASAIGVGQDHGLTFNTFSASSNLFGTLTEAVARLGGNRISEQSGSLARATSYAVIPAPEPGSFVMAIAAVAAVAGSARRN